MKFFASLVGEEHCSRTWRADDFLEARLIRGALICQRMGTYSMSEYSKVLRTNVSAYIDTGILVIQVYSKAQSENIFCVSMY